VKKMNTSDAAGCARDAALLLVTGDTHCLALSEINLSKFDLFHNELTQYLAEVYQKCFNFKLT